MLLPPPENTSPLLIAQFEDYTEMHETYITAYKLLYNDIAMFSILPEQFITEADPVIQQYIDNVSSPAATAMDKQRLQTVSDFISRFYSFTDKATEMFTDHQALAGQTVQYLQQMALLKQKAAIEQNYLALIPQLEKLNTSLLTLQQSVAFLKEELELLKPGWVKVAGELQH